MKYYKYWLNNDYTGEVAVEDEATDDDIRLAILEDLDSLDYEEVDWQYDQT